MKKPLDTRKTLIALAVIVLSFGALIWQVADYQGKQAKLQTLFSEEQTLEWRAAPDKERKAALSSITNQLDAFKREDYLTASKYQSQALRHNFPDAKTFGEMIKKGYPQFARSRSVAFGAAQIDKSGKVFRVPVSVIGADGLSADALYVMILEDGLWRVSGVSGGNARTKPQPKENTTESTKV